MTNLLPTRWLLIGVLFVLTITGLAFQRPPEIRYPAKDIGIEVLAARAQQQQQTANQFRVYHQFRFEDRIHESGITFVHRIVDDSGLNYKAVHYDHGNGLAVADVDGDGLSDVYFVNQAASSELWKNLGNGRFQDITNEIGRAHV